MSRVVEVLRSRWFITLIGVLALSLLVWLAGPHIKFGERALLAGVGVRLGVIAVLFIVWALLNVRVQVGARRTNTRVIEGMAAGPAGDGADAQGREEVQLLAARFREALEVLRRSDGGKVGRRYVYELPWYVIIGPPGSGKTTALTNSGLRFPLAEKFGRGGLKGVGGTRNCDWFFTDEAVLIDTAGRYTTQDSHAEADAQAWQGFLDLLKKNRPRRPLNGVLVAFSLHDLMLASPQERELHARTVRNRVQELTERLGLKIPVYLLFTKADLVAGFGEFFDDLGREERDQVWGVSFADDVARPAEAVGAEFDALLARLNERLLYRLGQEREPQRRALIYGFLQRLGSLREALVEFVAAAFEPDRYRAPPKLRGFYLTSGTQQGAPIDRLLSGVAAGFGLPRAALPTQQAQERPFFLTRLFREVIFPEADLAGTDRRVERRNAAVQFAAYAGALAIAGLAALAWSTSFTRNQIALRDVDAALDTYATGMQAAANTPGEPALLEPLDALRRAVDVYPESGTPFLMGLGLYMGDGMRARAQAAYHTQLRQTFLPRVAERVGEQLRTGPQDPDYQFEALRVYLMLGYPEHRKADAVGLWMDFDWSQRLPDKGAAQTHLAEHLRAAIDGDAAAPLDEALVASTRARLALVPLPERIYARIKRQAASEYPGDLSLSTVGGDFGRIYTTGDGAPADGISVPALFTAKGFHEYFLARSEEVARTAAEDAWVLGEDVSKLSALDTARYRDAVLRLYYEEYIRRWQEVLDRLEVARPNGVRETAATLESLSAPGSPMRRVLELVERNTRLDRKPEGPAGGAADLAAQAGAAAQKLGGAAGAQAQRLGAIAALGQQAAQALPVPGTDTPGAAVAEHFATVNNLLYAANGGAEPYSSVHQALGQLFGYVNGIARAPSPAEAALQAAASRMGGGADPVAAMRTEAARQPQPVARWLITVADAAWNAVAGASGGHLDGLWQSLVVAPCQRSIQGRYPFADSERDVALADFARFFGPGQILDSFVQEHLSAFVDTRRWVARSADGRGFGVSAGTLAQLRRAARIRDAFFNGGSAQPRVAFTLKPLSLDRNVARVLLDLDGQQLTYRHGPPPVDNLVWPNPGAGGRVRLLFTDLAGAQSSLTTEGPWAWFRMLDRAQISGSGERYQVTLSADQRTVVYELRASSVASPFDLRELRAFRCSGRL